MKPTLFLFFYVFISINIFQIQATDENKILIFPLKRTFRQTNQKYSDSKSLGVHRLLQNSKTYSNSNKVPVLNVQNLDYNIEIRIGSKQQVFSLLIDLGSPFVWVVSKDAEQDTIENRYDCGSSTSCKVIQPNFSVTYGENAAIEGDLIKDILYLNRKLVVRHQIIEVTNLTLFETLLGTAEGLFGLSRAGKLANSTLLDDLKSQGEIDYKAFAIYFSTTDLVADSRSNVVFGGFDKTKYKATDFKFFNIISDDHLYTVSFNSWQIDQQASPVQQKSAILDSGTSATLIVPPEDFPALLRAIRNVNPSCKKDLVDSSIVCQCKQADTRNFPSIIVNLVDIENKLVPLSIDPDFYVILDPDYDKCHLNIRELDEVNGWIFGLPFLRIYYTYFDLEKNIIGLTKAIHSF